MNKKIGLIVFLWIFVVGMGLAPPLRAQTAPNVRYIHDEAGNLIGSVDANGNATIYNFDAVGNLVSIDRLSASGPVDIFFVEPNRADVGVRPGTAVTIYGIGFSDVPAQNQVAFFNGVAAVVDASTPTTIRTRVPAGARTGPVQVTSPLGMATSRFNFKINNCINPPAGLVSWWPGDGNAREIIGSNYGVRRGTVAFVPGRVSHAFNFDGADGFVLVRNRANLNPSRADFSVEFWMKTASTGVLRAVLNKREDCGNSSFWDIRLLPIGHLQVELVEGLGIDDYAIISTNPVNDGNWHHIGLVRQSVTATLYIDGEVQGSVNTKSAISISNTAPVLFGNDPCVGADGTRFYQGLIDEVSWFNRALSSGEVQNIFTAAESGKCKPE